MTNIIWRDLTVKEPWSLRYRQTIFVREGYDRRNWPGGQHGWRNDEWMFVVGRHRGALTLCANTGRLFGGSLPQGLESDKQCSDLTLHLSFPSTPEEVLSDPHDGCIWLEGKCYQPYSTALGAYEFWPESSAQEFDNVERFYARDVFPWLKLVQRFEELYTPRLEASAKLPRRCPTCKGSGLVPTIETILQSIGQCCDAERFGFPAEQRSDDARRGSDVDRHASQP